MTRLHSLLTGLALQALAVSTACAAPCPLTPVMEAPLRNDLGFLSAPVTVAGRTVSFIVDTGSEGSLISPWFARFMKLPEDPNALTHVSGTGGSAGVVPNVIIPSLQVGSSGFGPVSMPLGFLPSRPNITPPVEGLLGGDVLAQDVLEIDAPHGRVAMWNAPGRKTDACSVEPPPLPGVAWQSLDAEERGHRMVLRVRLDGHDLTALLDSGARSRILSRRAAEAMGLTEEQLATDPGGTTAGVDGKESVYRWHKFHSLTIGQETEYNPVLTVSAVSEQSVDMLLGSDWFATRHVWIFYRHGRIFVNSTTTGRKDEKAKSRSGPSVSDKKETKKFL
ncbi:MAG: aspartyl protease family protein [Acetobacter aceti]|uniref:aspartyl protease family protein n=1 Tax=Acetobacter aceti TaxID=435 RepID=UPI001F2CA3A1|nr:aspartyl protease family protein [Acetobacter aceti]